MSKDISKAQLPLSGASDPVSIDPDGDGFREAMRRAVTGVTIIPTYHEGRPCGMTVSAFAPACMKPPTLLFCVDEATVTAEPIQRYRRFCVNLLSHRKIPVSQLSSRGSRSEQRPCGKES